MISRQKMIGRVFIGFMVIMVLVSFGAGTAAAKKSITLTVGSTWAPDWPSNIFMKMWEDKVTKASNGRIKFRNFWAGSMVKMGEETDALESGSIDIACLCACFYPTDMPMNNIYWGMFFIPQKSSMQVKIYQKLRKEFPQMDQEIEKHNCKILFLSAVDTYGLFTKKPLASVAELKGKKISGIGRYHPRFFKPIGCELISMHVADRYSAMQTGVLDGDFLPLLFTKPYRYWEVAKYRVLVDSGANHGMPHCISMKAWNKLSPEDQKILMKAGREMEVESAEWCDREAKRFLKELEEQYGVQTISFPFEEKIKWCDAIGDPLWSYARDLEKAGLPGFDYVKAYVRHAEELGYQFPCNQYKNPPAN